MRSYQQFCGLAKALDILGDRWTLLIVRELMLSGPSRYTDLQYGLPGVATNLLSDRLRKLEEAGVVTRVDPAPPVATALYSLTEWGQELRPVLDAAGRWAGRLMRAQQPGDRFRSHWLAIPLEGLLRDCTPARPPIRVELRADQRPLTLETSNGGIRVRPGTAKRPNAVLTGPPELIIGLLAGRITLAAARARRLRFEGDPAVLRRIGPVA